MTSTNTELNFLLQGLSCSQLSSYPTTQRGLTFHSRCTIQGKVCEFAISGGSSHNLASTYLVEKLGLDTKKHPFPYTLQWFDGHPNIEVKEQVVISFSMGNAYHDMVLCDVVPLSSCHLLLGRTWQYDRRVVHDGYKNSYSFHSNGKKVILNPNLSRPNLILSSPPQVLEAPHHTESTLEPDSDCYDIKGGENDKATTLDVIVHGNSHEVDECQSLANDLSPTVDSVAPISQPTLDPFVTCTSKVDPSLKEIAKGQDISERQSSLGVTNASFVPCDLPLSDLSKLICGSSLHKYFGSAKMIVTIPELVSCTTNSCVTYGAEFGNARFDLIESKEKEAELSQRIWEIAWISAYIPSELDFLGLLCTWMEGSDHNFFADFSSH